MEESFLNRSRHSRRKVARIDSKFKKDYKPRFNFKLKSKELKYLLVLIVSFLVLFAMGKNNLMAYFTDFKSIHNVITIKANYDVSFNANTGTGTMENQTISYNVEESLNSNTFTKEGYDFVSWNTKADGTGTPYINEASVTNLGDITLYAQWEEKTYDVTYFYGDENFVGTNYVNTDIPLFSSNNIDRYFEVSLSLSNFEYLSGQDTNRNVFVCNQYERRSTL